jgi:hypothetical protein
MIWWFHDYLIHDDMIALSEHSDSGLDHGWGVLCTFRISNPRFCTCKYVNCQHIIHPLVAKHWTTVPTSRVVDPDPDPAFHFDANLDPDSNFQIQAHLKKCSNRLIFHTFWLVIYQLMRMRIQLIILMRIRIRILPFNLMRINADPDPQHCIPGVQYHRYSD